MWGCRSDSRAPAPARRRGGLSRSFTTRTSRTPPHEGVVRRTFHGPKMGHRARSRSSPDSCAPVLIREPTAPDPTRRPDPRAECRCRAAGSFGLPALLGDPGGSSEAERRCPRRGLSRPHRRLTRFGSSRSRSASGGPPASPFEAPTAAGSGDASRALRAGRLRRLCAQRLCGTSFPAGIALPDRLLARPRPLAWPRTGCAPRGRIALHGRHRFPARSSHPRGGGDRAVAEGRTLRLLRRTRRGSRRPMASSTRLSIGRESKPSPCPA
jgi:hypothetical protein